MDRARRLLDALGQEGLERVLAGTLDAAALARAAKAARLSYPGRRTLGIHEDDLRADLARKAIGEIAAGRALVRILDRICAAEIEEAASSGGGDPGVLTRRPPEDPDRLARLLYALAGIDGASARKARASILRRAAAPIPPREKRGRPGRPSSGGAGEQAAGRIEDLERRVGSAEATSALAESLTRSLREMRDDLREVREEVRALAVKLAAAGPAEPAKGPGPGEAPRVGLFVDVQNMYYGARQLGAKLDYGALIDEVSRDRRLVRALAFVVMNPEIRQGGFLAMLQQRNYEVRRKDLRRRPDGSSKGDWDLGIALAILDLAPSLDVVVLASGDGDFVDLVKKVRTMGPEVEVYSFSGSTARELEEACDRHVPIGDTLLLRVSAGG